MKHTALSSAIQRRDGLLELLWGSCAVVLDGVPRVHDSRLHGGLDSAVARLLLDADEDPLLRRSGVGQNKPQATVIAHKMRRRRGRIIATDAVIDV